MGFLLNENLNFYLQLCRLKFARVRRTRIFLALRKFEDNLKIFCIAECSLKVHNVQSMCFTIKQITYIWSSECPLAFALKFVVITLPV